MYRLAFPYASGALIALVGLGVGMTFSPSAHARTVLVDEVVAVVDLQGAGLRRSVLFSDVELAARLHRAYERGAMTLDDSLSRQQLEQALASFVDTLVVVGEAERLEVFRLDAREADAAVDRFLEAVGRDALLAWLKRTERDLDAVREFVLKRARVQRYLEGRFRLAARPRPAQVQQLWAMRTSQFASFEEARPVLESELEAGRFSELVSQFVNDVRRRVRIRTLRDFSSGELGTPMHGTVTAPQTKGLL